ncbi:hypothetical protein NP493_181g04044 [Ridgeia piscesae]|uniref:Uncharacterized protein n=1 Tax=Ridgeia piscesae TaxID=27915 RepID=A0AAD9UF37_RIDPI|nr:hypothetical protein NP493_181g04044 [Ridgeia piscesae]
MLTPQDLTSFKQSLDGRKLSPNYRFQGYPVGSFEKPRDPLHAPVINPKDLTTDADVKYARPHFFDPRKPKIYDEENKALLYGSVDMPSNKQTQKPVRDPFHEKTSAELKKFRAVQAEAEKEIEKYKHEKQRKAKDREEEKKQDLVMLQRYDPWGRPGGGAPNKGGSSSSENRSHSPKKNGSETQRSHQDDLNEEYGNFYASFGKPGGGAPLKTVSGTLKTEIKSDAAIHFQDTKSGRIESEQEFRYKNPRYDKVRYQQDLESQIKSKSVTHQELRLQELRRERETLTHEPFGKPGGGAPNMSDNRPSSYVTAKPAYYFDPWGKGVGQPRRDDRGEVVRHKFSDPHYGMEKLVQHGDNKASSELGVSLILSDGGGGGAPLKTMSGQVKSRLPITIKRTPFGGDVGAYHSPRELLSATVTDCDVASENRHSLVVFPDNSVDETVAAGSTDPELQPYDPWGRGGAGAPVYDSKGNPTPNVYGRIQQEKESATPRQKAQAAQEYLRELQGEMRDAERRKKAEVDYYNEGEVEMAALMKQGRVGQPKRDPNTGVLVNQHLGTSDVTKQKTNTRRQRTERSLEYHTELERAAEERRRLRALDQLKERQEDRQHVSTMNTFWGRSGAGAPNEHGTKMPKLDDILYTPRKEATNYYVKRYEGQHPDTPAAPYHYVRSTVPSLHTNMYEYVVPSRGASDSKVGPTLIAPYATGSTEIF